MADLDDILIAGILIISLGGILYLGNADAKAVIQKNILEPGKQLIEKGEAPDFKFEDGAK